MQKCSNSDAPRLGECYLLDLPDELLLHTVRVFDGESRQRSIYSLATVNRRLSHIACEELYRHPLIRPRHASRFVSQLLDNPKYLRKLSYLEILDETPSHDDTINWDEKYFHFGDIDELSDKYHMITLKCARALKALGIPDHSWRWHAGLQDGDPLAYIAVALAIAPKLQGLGLSQQYSRCLAQPRRTYRNTFGAPSRPYLAKSLEHVSQELKELILPAPAQDKKFHWINLSWSLSSVDMTVLKKVKRLTVSFLSISTEVTLSQAAMLLLPPNLQVLRIEDCGSRAVQFVGIFIQHERHKYKQLREVEMFWNAPNPSQVNDFDIETVSLQMIAENYGVVVHRNFPNNAEDNGRSTVAENDSTQTSAA